MSTFVHRHRDSVTSVLNGFDRVRFRGSLRWLCYADGQASSLESGWCQLFTEGLKSFVESE